MRTRHLFLIPIAAIVGVLLAYVLFTRWYLADVNVQNVTFEVTASPAIGFNLDKDAVRFGKIPVGGTAERKGNVGVEKPLIARIGFDEGLQGWVSADPQCIELDAGETRQVRFLVNVPADATPGNYSGTMRIVYTKRLPWSGC